MRCWLKNGSSLRDRCIDIDHAISMTYPVDCNINDINDKKKNNGFVVLMRLSHVPEYLVQGYDFKLLNKYSFLFS